MQLSVACNLIPKVVRMLSGRWIISHRCSWMTVYVSCCNAQSNLIVVIMSCTCIVMHSLFVNCPSVICLPSMLFICYGETPLVNCGPRSYFLYIDKTTTTNPVYLLQLLFCKHLFHTIRLILCFQQNR